MKSEMDFEHGVVRILYKSDRRYLRSLVGDSQEGWIALENGVNVEGGAVGVGYVLFATSSRP